MINKKNLSLLALATTTLVPSFFVVSCSSNTNPNKVVIIPKIDKDKILNIVAKNQSFPVDDISKLSWEQIAKWISDNMAKLMDKNFLVDQQILVGGGLSKESIFSVHANFDASKKSLIFNLSISESDKNNFFLNDKKETKLVLDFS